MSHGLGQLGDPVEEYCTERILRVGREGRVDAQECAIPKLDDLDLAGDPQVVGSTGDLSGPRTFFTPSNLGKPIRCTRDKDGVFRAFLNALSTSRNSWKCARRALCR